MLLEPGAPLPPPLPGALVCAFVNDMPDSAFLHTERQFIGLISAGAGDLEVTVVRYHLAGVPRGGEVASYIAARYRAIEHLWSTRADAVVVTGSEPLALDIVDEPYFGDLVDLVDWARDHARSMLLSCLAAHGALRHLDGIERRLLEVKATGVFAQEVTGTGGIIAGVGRDLVLPHSRLNDVASAALASRYEIVVASAVVGWSIARGRRDGCEIVLVQGHPEYDASSLLREYRRDVERYLTGARPGIPVLPEHCVAPDDEPALVEFHRRVLASGGGRAELLAALEFDALAKRAPWPWRSFAAHLYANWLAGAAETSGAGRRG